MQPDDATAAKHMVATAFAGRLRRFEVGMHKKLGILPILVLEYPNPTGWMFHVVSGSYPNRKV